MPQHAVREKHMISLYIVIVAMEKRHAMRWRRDISVAAVCTYDAATES